ncbi:MAG: hypothetical protein HQL96_13055 [Magnetococcales bacterium]|nr:hypothetical protein [Magnetococcales bacterium]
MARSWKTQKFIMHVQREGRTVLGALAMTGLLTVAVPAQGASYGHVEAWEVTSSVEVSKTEKWEDRSEEWSLKAQGKSRIHSAMPGNMRFQWGGVDLSHGMPTRAEDAYSGKGTAQIRYRLEHFQLSALMPGGVAECTFQGEVPYQATIVAMPGQPPFGGAQPLLPTEMNCKRSGEAELPERVSISLPASCEQAAPLQETGGKLTQSVTCEQNGVRITQRLEAVPVSAGR